MAKVVFINVYCAALPLLIITLIGSTLVTDLFGNVSFTIITIKCQDIKYVKWHSC